MAASKKPSASKPSAKKTFATIPAGTSVSWHYRSAIGHGTVASVKKMGTNPGNTMYNINEHDHHPGEPAVVVHSGKALTRSSASASKPSSAGKTTKARSRK